MLIIDRSVITDGGAALLNSGDPINITSIKTGSGSYTSTEDIKSRTALKSTQYSYAPSSVVVDGATRSVKALLSNYDPVTQQAIVTSDYTITEVGMFATVNGADVLFAIGVSYTGTLVPAYTGDNKSEIVVTWDMGVSGTDSITITASGAAALAVDFNNHVDDMVYTPMGVHGIRAVLDGNIIGLQVKDGDEWKDAGGGVKHGTASISPDTITVKYATPTVTATLITNSDGIPTVTSSDESVVTASISGTTITITGVSTGTATITVSIPETEKYTACEATIAVTAKMFPELVIGNTYFFGGHYWTAAEQLAEDVVCMQSQGMTMGAWPAYKLTKNYDNTKSYGNANTGYNGAIDGDNIANYDAVTQAWYTKYSSVEKTGQAYGSGLFLVSNDKCNQTTSGQQGSGNYWSALKTAATNYSLFGASYNLSWLGTVYNSNYAWDVSSSGDVGYGGHQSNLLVVAPAFNLDLEKVDLVNDSIILKGEEYPTIVSFANGTDAQIKAMLDAYYEGIVSWNDMGWNVGDTRLIHLDEMDAPSPQAAGSKWAAQDITVVILDHDKTDLATPVNGHTKHCITVGFREVMNNCITSYNDTGHIHVNGDVSYDTTFKKWANLYMRTYLNSIVLNAMQTSFKDMIKDTAHYCHTAYNTAADELVTDKLYVASYSQLFGTATYGAYTPTTHTEGVQLEYYKTSVSKIKKGNNNGMANSVVQDWWTGSPSNYYDSIIGYSWCFVNDNGTPDNTNGTNAMALSPQFGM